jgi:hypothetical protein
MYETDNIPIYHQYYLKRKQVYSNYITSDKAAILLIKNNKSRLDIIDITSICSEKCTACNDTLFQNMYLFG